jgi:hypothetical protein
MKKYPLSLAILALFLTFSCKKTNSGGGGSSSDPNSTYLSSVISYSPQQKVVDSFSYDSLHRLIRFSQYDYDSTSGSPLYNSSSANFTYQDNATSPTRYVYSDTLLGNYDDIHILSYDAQERIAKDTSYSGSGFVTYYSYPNNNPAATVLFEGTIDDNQIDTLFLTNGNTTSEHVYTSDIPGQPDVLDGIVQYGFSSTATPAYHAPITSSIGPLLSILEIDGFGGFVDFISKNAINKISGDGNGLPPGTVLNYTLTNDSKGRLSKMTFAGAAGGIIFNYY